MAYQINLVHSILPHHHHEDAAAVVSHSQEHQDEDHHHHHEDEQEQGDSDFSLAHLIAEIAHNPSALVIHTSTSENTQKTKTVVHLLAFSVSELLLPDDRTSLERSHYREVDYSSQYSSTAPLRGPPVV